MSRPIYRETVRSRTRTLIAVGALTQIARSVAATASKGGTSEREEPTVTALNAVLVKWIDHMQAPLDAPDWDVDLALTRSGDILEALILSLVPATGIAFDILYDLHALFMAANRDLRIAGATDSKRSGDFVRWSAASLRSATEATRLAAKAQIFSELDIEVTDLAPDLLVKLAYGKADLTVPDKLGVDIEAEKAAAQAEIADIGTARSLKRD